MHVVKVQRKAHKKDMFIESLELYNFRNYTRQEFGFTKGVNLILGDNAQGKTNILEAITALTACRTSKPPLRQESIRFEADFAEIVGYVFHDDVETKLGLRLTRMKRTTDVYKNDVRQKRMADIHGALRTVSFCPDDLYLIRAGAVQRRNFIDRALVQISPRYGEIIAHYEKLLAQKNAILKQQEEKPSLLNTLDDYTIQLCQYGAQVILFRAKYCRQLMEQATKIHGEIAPEERLSARYCTVSKVQEAFPQLADCMTQDQVYTAPHLVQVDFNSPAKLPTLGAVRDVLLDYAMEMRSREIASRSTLVGPHKDDLELCINEKKAADFASQGQVRTAALSLKMGEREICFTQDGYYPVLLLDDVLSELDQKRQDFILNQVKNGQVFITACDPVTAARFDKGRKFIIQNGDCVQTAGEISW